MKDKSRAAFVVLMMIFLTTGTGFADNNIEAAFSMEPLRDPFWPVGYFPDDWQTESHDEDKPSITSGSDWDGPAAQIRVTGTSRMDNKAVAIINGDLKEVGDSIEVSYSGRIYQWKLKEINASGTVDIERVGIRTAGIGFHPGDKK